jgi:uncharacterized membrane protein YfcA
VFVALGLPVHEANGTNRVAIIMQNLSSTAIFTRRGLLDWQSGIRLAIPTILGSVVGSQIAATIDETIFRICLAVVMVAVLIFTIFGNRMFRQRGGEIPRVGALHWVVFFLIGVYGGYIYVGSGYLVLLAALGMLGQDMVGANVLKNFVLLLAIPFSLAVFIVNGDVNWTYGLIHGVGNMAGAFLASRYAIGWGMKFLRWFMVAVVIVCLADVTGLISIRNLVLAIIS